MSLRSDRVKDTGDAELSSHRARLTLTSPVTPLNTSSDSSFYPLRLHAIHLDPLRCRFHPPRLHAIQLYLPREPPRFCGSQAPLPGLTAGWSDADNCRRCWQRGPASSSWGEQRWPGPGHSGCGTATSATSHFAPYAVTMGMDLPCPGMASKE